MALYQNNWIFFLQIAGVEINGCPSMRVEHCRNCQIKFDVKSDLRTESTTKVVK